MGSSIPAWPVPLISSVYLLLVWNTYLNPVWMSSMILKKGGCM